MGKIVDDLRKAIDIRQEFEEFKILKEKCLDIFNPNIGLTMESIEKTINTEWHRLFRKEGMYCRKDIRAHFTRLKNGYINRAQFKEEFKKIIEQIEEKYKFLKKSAEEAEKQFSNDYDQFFKKDLAELEGDSKYIFFMFSQPEVKKIVEDFLKS